MEHPKFKFSTLQSRVMCTMSVAVLLLSSSVVLGQSVPTISRLSRTFARPGASSIAVDVYGAGFDENPLPTMRVVSTDGADCIGSSEGVERKHNLMATISGACLMHPGTLLITVSNGGGGVPSNMMMLHIGNPAPSLTFTESAITVGTHPQAIITGDFNGDGKLDFAVANEGTCKRDPPPAPNPNCTDGSKIWVLRGNGDGTFRTPVILTPGDFPYGLVAGDFNGDGRLDLASANEAYQQDQPGSVSVFLNNGNGFGAATSYSTGATPFAIVAGDFTCDGNLDLVTVNNHNTATMVSTGLPQGGVSLLIGNGNGTFTEQNTVYSECVNNGCSFPIGASAGDFNNDGLVDLAVLDWNKGVGELATLKRTCDAGRNYLVTASSTSLGSNSLTVGMGVGDFNADGNLDGTFVGSGNGSAGSVTVELGDGHGSFTPSSTCVGTNCGTKAFPNSVAVGDFDRDGKLDVAVAYGNFSAGSIPGTAGVTFLLGDGTGGFSSRLDRPITGSMSTAVAAGDFNGDGKIDFLITNYYTNTVTLLLQQ